MQPLSETVLLDKIRGCFIGKNVGGTLGAPFEAKTGMTDISFYTQKLDGNPLPNDDLDLQLLWLVLAEYYGLDRLTPRHFGEYWLDAVLGPWGEYANCRWNCTDGFLPPLSGACENDGLRFSNGAWIRSEIWACLCAGRPDDAIRFARMDACADHSGDGIYAEMFTAALEAAAFYCSDIRELIRIGLSKIPPEGRLRESIELAVAGYEAGKPWQTVRNEIVEKNADIGWFQAAVDVPFTVLALLYGEGDFGKTVCLAVNCGDDTDCTAATAGSVLGIILGADALPEKWLTPIGDGIATISLKHFALPLPVPKTVTELAGRIMDLRRISAIRNPLSTLPQEDFLSTEFAETLWNKPEYELQFDLLFASVTATYPDGPYLEPGKPCRLRIAVHDPITSAGAIRMRWLLPENWRAETPEMHFGVRNFCITELETAVIPPENEPLDAMEYLYLEVTSDERHYPTVITVPFRVKGAFAFPHHSHPYLEGDGWIRRSGLIAGIAKRRSAD